MTTLDLQKIRKEFNVTQKALADMLNINQSFLSNIENGRSPLPPDKREKILQAFNISRPEDYTIEVSEPQNIKNVQRSFIGGNKFTNNSSIESSELLIEIRKMLELYFGNNTESDNVSKILSDQLDKSAKRISVLEEKNESLYEKIDKLQARILSIQEDNLTLRRILAERGIEYEK